MIMIRLYFLGHNMGTLPSLQDLQDSYTETSKC